jgi:hypothetical protein
VVVAEGVTFRTEPVAKGAEQEDEAPQLPLYHFQAPPVPVLPFTVKVILAPLQIVLPLTLLLMEVGPQGWLTVMVTDTQAVVLQLPSARTK